MSAFSSSVRNCHWLIHRLTLSDRSCIVNAQMEIKIECAHDKVVALADLKPHPANPNKHPEAQITLLAKIIKAQGWRNPIVVSNRSGLITKGHGRYEAAKLIGAGTAPVGRLMYSISQRSVYDSFVGSGTTIIACEQLGRKCRAMEIDPGYCAVSLQRWADATGKKPKLLTQKK